MSEAEPPAEGGVSQHEYERVEELLLISRIADGDGHAFGVLIDRFLPRLFRYAYSLVKARGQAEDIAQEAFLRFWKASQEWNPDVSVYRWLLKVVRHLCLDELRRTRPHELTTDDLDTLPSDEKPQDVVLSQKDLERYLEEALLQLPARQREAVWLTYYEGMSGAQAASVMTISVDALESLLARGKKNMRNHLSALKAALMDN